MAKILPLQHAKILYDLTKDSKEKELPAIIDIFVNFLKKNQSVNKLPYIIQEFEKYVLKVQGKEKAEIITAHNISEKSLEEIQKILKLQGEIVMNIDKDLIGGVVIKVGNKIFDASIKTKINKLKQHLI
ncbi:MAG: ATP synthase F1 subunit delta [Bacteroidales bacterium]|nr:ATP synthase F1 subunit delta [Bacteroidales bacterium]